jgi:hypothetical protein
MPMISREKKFIFIQVPKNAGCSINMALKKFSTNRDLSRWNGVNGHAPLHVILRESPEFSSYFKFAVVRNPFDWLVSYYEYKRTDFRGDLYPYICNMKFQDFVVFLEKIKQGNIVGFNQDVMNVVKGQNSWTHHQGIQIINKIILYEKLNESFGLVSQELNLGNIFLTRNNISKRNPTFEYYDKRTKYLVADMFRHDFEFFGYEKNFKTITWL